MTRHVAPDHGGRQWWKSSVVYQIYPRSFADSNGDGIGDLPGVTSRLDHLAALGVDVVWLSPVYPSPQDDNGYDVADYCDIDPMFGTLADLDDLAAGLRARGMKLVMDLVFNHTSDEHPWFVESRAATDSARRDWYWWRPARPGTTPGTPGAEPNNWGSVFSGPAWTFDETTGEYYLHLFSRKQPDLNWEHPDVRHALHDVMRFWLDRGVDGFRMDVVNFVSKDPALPDGLVAPGARFGDGSPHFLSGPRIHEFLQELHREVIAPHQRPTMVVGEMPGVTLEDARRFTDPDRREVDMVFQFEHVDLDAGASKWDARPLDLRALKASLSRWQVGLADRGWNSLYWNNHDQPRAVSRFGHDGEHRVMAAKMLATVLHLHRGTPYVYQGEELGLANVAFGHIDDFRDIESRNHYAEALAHGAEPAVVLEQLRARSRDNARTPMPWDDSPTGGFGSTRPWIALDPGHRRTNAGAALDDPDSVFHHYRRLIALRRDDPVVVHGDFTLLLADDPQVYAFTRRLDGVELLVLGNFGDDPVEPALPDVAAWIDADVVVGTGSGVSLGPWEGRVLRRVH